MKKLSKPLSSLQPAYEVVIIGSGYGGSIAASRFARAGMKVCLLEKGKEFQPGEYPDTLGEAEGEMQLNTDKRRAGDNGLYEFHLSEDISVFKGCGLGGTSLVNAGVVIEPEDRVFQDPRWPSAILADMDGLKEGYRLAREMLQPAPYPENTEGYPELKKAAAMKLAAGKMNYPFRYADINVSFTEGVNKAGIEHKRCVNCGDCVTGCNHAAKNTLIMNYLPDAVNHGAEIYCNIGVDHVEREGEAWVVYFKAYHTDMDKFHAPPLFVRAQNVIVAGGTLGSTEILLRSRANGLSLSSRLGEHFTGNGDVLGFSYNCRDDINGMGLGKYWNSGKYAPVGPCITGIIDMRNQPELTDGLTFEEGSIPAPIASVVNMSMLPLSGLTGTDTRKEGFSGWVGDLAEEAESLIGGPYRGAINKMQTYLVMTHDDGKGVLDLQNDCLNISWPGVGKQPIFEKVSQAMLQSTEALEGTYIKNVLWNKLFNYDLITVHPLGGCCMGEDASTGVTDHTGNVYNGQAGKETHPGLYVLDGSIVPLPLGTNPLYTISALTERACGIITKTMNHQIVYEDHTPQSAPGMEPPTEVQFTETMKGYWSTKEQEDFERAYQLGQKEKSLCMFTLTIRTGDMNTFLSDPGHTGSMSGTLTAPALSDKPLMVSDGVFNLFVRDPGKPGNLRMKYAMRLTATGGKTYYFDGYKDLKDDQGLDLWQDTTRLFVTLYDGEDHTAPVLGKGILEIATHDFAVQMTTMKVINAPNTLESLKILKEFSSFFSKNIVDTYFKKLF